MWTLTRYEQPQRLDDVMRHAWRMNRRRARALIGRCIRAAWILAKRRAGRRLPERPRGLLSYLRSAGGLRPCGELRHIGAPLNLLRRRGLSLDFAARLASDHGYAVGDCVATLLEMIRDELFGDRHVAAGDQAIDLELDAWEAWHAEIFDAVDDECPF